MSSTNVAPQGGPPTTTASATGSVIHLSDIPGAPASGVFAQTAIDSSSPLATEILLPLLKDTSSSGLARLSAPEVVALALLTRQTRYATASDILKIVANWPCFQDVISDYTMKWLLSISDEEVTLNELHRMEPIQLLRKVRRPLGLKRTGTDALFHYRS